MVKKQQHGFTLLELLGTMSIAAILVAFAVPAMTSTLKNSRMNSSVNDLVSSFNFARNEAVRRGVEVTVCRSTDGIVCTDAADWATGWIVTADVNGDGTFENSFDELFRVSEALSSGLQFIKSNAARVVYDVSGGAKDAGGNAITSTLTLCDSSQDGERGYRVTIAVTGHVSSRKLDPSDC